MKNPTSHTANRTIDVIFVHPKYRSYVIWHDGVFYQLTRMNLTQKAWDRRVVYDGLLDEIFVAKESCEQGETDERTWQELGLNVVKLPDELHNITASKFLAWWTVNRYSFWHAKDTRDVSDKDVQNQPAPTAEQKPQQKIQQEVGVKPQVSASTAQQSAMDKKTSKNSDVMDDAVQTNQSNQNNQVSQASQTLTEQTQMQAPPKSTHKSHKPLEQLSGDDIFDALLDDLVDEVGRLR